MLDLYDLQGMYVGQLTPEELDDFEQACKQGVAYRSYEGLSGIFGMAKVRLSRQALPEKEC